MSVERKVTVPVGSSRTRAIIRCNSRLGNPSEAASRLVPTRPFGDDTGASLRMLEVVCVETRKRRLLGTMAAQAPPPAQVGASPDRLGAGRGKPAEQLDVVGLVVATGRAST